MQLAQILENDKDKLLSELSGKTPAQAAAVVDREAGRILIKYQSEEENADKRLRARQMTEALKAAVPLIDSAGDIKLWERETAHAAEKKKAGALFWVLLVLSAAALAGAIAACAAADIPALLPEKLGESRKYFYALPAAAGILFFLSGLRLGRRGRPLPQKKEQKMEIYTDGEKIYRALYAAFLSIDMEIQAEENKEHAHDGKSPSLTSDEAAFCSGVFEAGYASDDAALLECMENLRYLLHKKGIETADYTKEHAAWFEKMPGKETATIKPALIKDGGLICRGSAAVNEG